ncbi:hypothetical protein [Geobacter sp. DSM 9736]|uniref:hypothetical protein n=1 Tax=Geobacter sp. DSM 9736 TaxID=1277350 RepID=UPI000B60B96D|nr:hypothetical protein [Geobacter sp. DSM 9736]SNB45446.1 hypothetical protein SAMN06269301_0859 [Geobacter sp. DSM 9736]
MKVTERTLVELCRRVNGDQLKCWNSGLKVERCGNEYILIRLIRKPKEGQPRYLDIYSGSPREVKAFIDGYVHAAELTNRGD